MPIDETQHIELRDRMLVKENGYLSNVCEACPFVLHERLLLLEAQRPASSSRIQDHYLTIKEVETGRLLSTFAEGYSLPSVWVKGDVVHVYASRWDEKAWNDVTLFRSADLKRWDSQKVLDQEEGEHVFNTSVCSAADGYVMAYETDDPTYVPFTIKFARSRDLVSWTKIQKALFGPDRYAACPCLRYCDGWYYMMYLEHLKPEWRFETYMARSTDLRAWEPSPRNPIIAPGRGEDINASDPDLAEYRGRVYLYYSIGDQRTYSRLKRAVFPGTLAQFLRWCYLPSP